MVPADPAPEVPDPSFWSGQPSRSRSRSRSRRRRRIRPGRVGRARTVAAIVLVAGLAAAWIATSQRSSANEPTPAAASDAPHETPDDTVVTGPQVTRLSADRRRLQRMLPEAARCADAPSSTAAEATCSIALVAVHYELVAPPDALRSAYLRGVLPGLSGGSATLAAGSGSPACARGAEDERAWSRPLEPSRAVGRYACRIEEGRAAMWWTVDDRGVLAHATAPDADLISLFAWWQTHSER